jgi:AcrR family transcriptional regulator
MAVAQLDTAGRILQAAFNRLREDGYARLNTRDIATEAGVNHALIHYYFGTKEKLVIAVLDDANRRLIARQNEMYGSPGGFAEKWAKARAFYRDDLASGFVKVQMELWAASLSNPELRREFLPRILEWHRTVEAAVRDAFWQHELRLPFSPEAAASWIVSFWFGMEWAMLLGVEEGDAHHQEALDAMERVLEALDESGHPRARASDSVDDGGG